MEFPVNVGSNQKKSFIPAHRIYLLLLWDGSCSLNIPITTCMQDALLSINGCQHSFFSQDKGEHWVQVSLDSKSL